MLVNLNDMKLLTLFVFFLILSPVFSQVENLPDPYHGYQENLPFIFYNRSEITTLDLFNPAISAMEVFQFDMGSFQNKYHLKIFTQELRYGKVVATDTLFNAANTYSYFVEGQYRNGFYNEIKIFTLKHMNYCSADIRTYAFSTQADLSLQAEGKEDDFLLKDFKETQWKLNEAIPLLIFAFPGPDSPAQEDDSPEILMKTSEYAILVNYLISSYE